jgi:hypothetical protein
MILADRAVVMFVAALLLVAGCEHGRPMFPETQPFMLEGVGRGSHLTESQAIQVAITEATAHGVMPSIYSSPKASFKDGEWHVYFGEPPGPPPAALGNHFSVYVYERSNTVSFSPGR